MKKVLAVVIATIMMALCLTGCTSVKSDIQKYCANEDVQGVVSLLGETTKILEEAEQKELTDIDGAIALCDDAMKKADEAIELAESIEPKTDEVKDVHSTLVDATKDCKESLSLMKDVLNMEKTGDDKVYETKAKAIEKAVSYGEKTKKFVESVTDLAEEQEADIDTDFMDALSF